MSVIIRERERERERDRDRNRDWDDRSSAYRDSPRESFTTVKQYRIPRDDDVTTTRTERLAVYDRERDRRSNVSTVGRDTRGIEETRIIRRERTPEPEPEREVERDIRIRRLEPYKDPAPERRFDRDIRIERFEREREPEPRRFEREYRYERDVDTLSPRREPYELERYSKSTEYFRPEAPQPIIIRQEPQQIIIQEAPRAPIVIPAPPKEESDFQVIQRSEVIEDRQIARREPREADQEDYYYERRTREVSGGDHDKDVVEERFRRRNRDVSPGDSISQHGREYSSDDSMVYVRKETRESYGRDESPRHRRHLAEGAIAGLGAAEILRHHREKEGKDSSRGSRVGKDIGAAALGAVAAQGISRARSHRDKSRRRSRDRDRSQSRSRSRSHGRRRHRRDRSRSRSKSRARQLAGVGLGVAALAAAVTYANKKNNKEGKEGKEPVDDRRRSRSRTRRHSVSEVPDDARNPSHRKKKIAQAGLAGAAVAGLVERARSKSRDRRGKSRSKSRIRTGLPIAAAGLGSAAVASIFEKRQANKAEKEDKAARREDRARRRESRSRSRSVPYDGSRDPPIGDSGLIEYGDQPVYSGGQDYYNRPASQAGYYGAPADAMIPAVAAGAAYGATRNESRHRDQSVSSSGSDSRRRRRHRRRKSNRDDSRSRSRTRELATAGLAAAGAGLAASQYEKSKQQRKEEKRERRRREKAEQERGYDDYPPQQSYPPISSPPPGAPPAGYQENYYPSTNSFPPPPPPNAGYQAGQNYNPADYPAQPGQQPGGQIHPDYGYPPHAEYTPPAPGQYSPAAADPYAAPGSRTRRGDENVSAAPSVNAPSGAPVVSEHRVEEGLSTPRASSPPFIGAGPIPQQRATSQPPPATKTVHFDRSSHSSSSSPSSREKIRKRRHRTGGSIKPNNDNDISSPSPDRSRHHRRRVSHNDVERSPSPAPSDATVDLPDRFDKYGRRKPERGEDPLADKIDEFLSGKGPAGKIFNKLTGALGVDNEDRDRRHRR